MDQNTRPKPRLKMKDGGLRIKECMAQNTRQRPRLKPGRRAGRAHAEKGFRIKNKEFFCPERAT
jgi:hypothetical protein